MKQQLFNALNTICPNNVFLQGTLDSNEAYPESFITYWTNYTADRAHYDDDVHSVDWQFSVIFYSSDPLLVETTPLQIRTALKALGYIPQGKGSDVMADNPAYTGWAMDFIKTEIL